MARREPSPLLGASESRDLADVARRDLMVANGARQLGVIRELSHEQEHGRHPDNSSRDGAPAHSQLLKAGLALRVL